MEEASLDGNSLKLFTEQFDQKVDLNVPLQEGEHERLRLSRHFIECIREGKEPISSSMSGLTNNLILDAIYQSSESGQEVRIDWDL